jgi:molybdopterin molybdotransferase
MKQLHQDSLIPYDEALLQLVSKVSPSQATVVKPLLQAFGDVLAESQSATINVPNCDNSAMDGYALNTADLSASGEIVLPISQRIAAGEEAQTLEQGTAARIFTGAPIPVGADAVIMQERVQLNDHAIHFDYKPTSGENIRPAGNDLHRGDRILEQGCRMRAQDIGLAASVGLESLPREGGVNNVKDGSGGWV